MKVRIEIKYDSQNTSGGITYYHFWYGFLDLGDYIDILTSGILGRILQVIEWVIPPAKIYEYCEKVLDAGENWGGYTPSNDLYLLYAKVQGHSHTKDFGGFVVKTVYATYTEYPPDDGVTFLPDYDPPTTDTHWENPLPDGLSLYMPIDLTTLAQAEVEICMRNISYGWTTFNALVLDSAWGGADPQASHFLANLDEFALLVVYDKDIRFVDYTQYSILESGLDNSPPWYMPEWAVYDSTSGYQVWHFYPYLFVPPDQPIIAPSKLPYEEQTPPESGFPLWMGDANETGVNVHGWSAQSGILEVNSGDLEVNSSDLEVYT